MATLFDDDGIVVRFMNCATEGNGIRDAAAASALVQQVHLDTRRGPVSLNQPLSTSVCRCTVEFDLTADLRVCASSIPFTSARQAPIAVVLLSYRCNSVGSHRWGLT